MPLRAWTVGEALGVAITGLASLEADPRLASNEQAIAGELRQADQQALNVLRPDNTIQPNQRNARATTIEDKVFALEVIDKAHPGAFAVTELYDFYELSQDAAIAIRAGEPGFVSSVEA